MAIKEFIPLGFPANRSNLLPESEGGLDRVMLISLKPLLYGIWLPDGEETPTELSISCHQQRLCHLTGSEVERFDLTNGVFVLWQPQKTRLSRLTLKERFWELPKIFRQSRRSKFRFEYPEISHLAAAYYYPRKIYVVVVAAEDYLNIFPMDLHLKDPASMQYVFALQLTNLATEEIKQNRQVVICEIAADSIATAYGLGKNHGKTNLFKQELPFALDTSKTFGIPVPEFAIGYREVEVGQWKDLGSHTLFLGKIVYEELPKKSIPQLYHVHRFYEGFLLRNRLLEEDWKLEVS